MVSTQCIKINYSNNIRKKRIPFLVEFLFFVMPFCYPFRPIISRYTHLHVYLVMYLPVILLCILTFYKCDSIVMSNGIGVVAIFYAYALIGSPDYDTGLKWIVNIVAGIALANLFYYYEFQIKDAKSYIFGVMVCGVLLLPDVISKLPVSLLYCYRVRNPFMDGDVSIGPNAWAVTVAICFMIAYIYYTYTQNHLTRVVLLGCMMFLAWQLLMTSSRTQFYSLFLCIAVTVFLWSLRENGGICSKAILIVLFITIALVLVIIVISPTLFFSGNSRLTQFDFNGRIEIWKTSLRTFKHMDPIQWLFGCGTGGASVYNYIKSGEYYETINTFSNTTVDHISTHNMYLDTLLSTGIIGTLLVLFYYIKVLLVMIKHYSIEFMIPMYILIAGVAGHFFSSWDYCLIIAFIEYYQIRNQHAGSKIRLIYRF